MVLFTLSSAQNCIQLLGMQSGTISDCQISASSERKFHFGPANARLRFSGTDVRVGAWVAGTQDRNQWLQLDFGNETTVTGIDTHGRASERCPKCNDWVEKYNVAYSQDNVTFHQYKEDGQVKVFQTELDWLCRTRSRVICLFLLPFLKEFLANSDRDSIVRHVLSPPVVARYFRINPTEWKDRIAMRVELLGCRAGMDHPHLPTVLEPRLALTSYQSPVSLLRHQHFTKGLSTLSSLNWSYRMTISSFLSASRPSASPNSAPSTAGAPAFSQPASTRSTLPPRMTSPAAVTATSSGRNPAAPTSTETSSQQQKQASFIDRTSSDVEMQSRHWKRLSGRGEFWGAGDQNDQLSLTFWIQACCGHQSVLAYADSHFLSCLSVGKLSTRFDLGFKKPACCFIEKPTQVPWEKKCQVFRGKNCPFRRTNAVPCSSCYIIWVSRQY